MSYEVRFKGHFLYISRVALNDAVARVGHAFAYGGERQSFVTVENLQIDGCSIDIALGGSCPASMWDDTMAFLRVLGEAASWGSVIGYYEGRREGVVEASGPPLPKRRVRVKRKRRTYGGKKVISRNSL